MLCLIINDIFHVYIKIYINIYINIYAKTHPFTKKEGVVGNMPTTPSRTNQFYILHYFTMLTNGLNNSPSAERIISKSAISVLVITAPISRIRSRPTPLFHSVREDVASEAT